MLIPEALGPLILGYTVEFVALVDMSAIAGVLGGGGLGSFAIAYGYRQFNPAVTWVAVIAIVVIVQVAKFAGNHLARKTSAGDRGTRPGSVPRVRCPSCPLLPMPVIASTSWTWN